MATFTLDHDGMIRCDGTIVGGFFGDATQRDDLLAAFNQAADFNDDDEAILLDRNKVMDISTRLEQMSDHLDALEAMWDLGELSDPAWNIIDKIGSVHEALDDLIS